MQFNGRKKGIGVSRSANGELTDDEERANGIRIGNQRPSRSSSFSAWLDLQPLQIQADILILGPDLNSEWDITECVNELEATGCSELSNLSSVRQTAQKRLRILWCDDWSLDGVRLGMQVNNRWLTNVEAQALGTLRQNQREQICHFVFRAGH